ncbi:hypothetical protein RJ640_025083 [Escallonia rubra]|uniref:Poly [ADP-ribose] polymerase n=1 Tax=Escallonia rubra TaxID=112253 RepID=A0AA88R5X4_9ASTE|nr:hypothetical protein RJ640_025083 [Escallonia rubra]
MPSWTRASQPIALTHMSGYGKDREKAWSCKNVRKVQENLDYYFIFLTIYLHVKVHETRSHAHSSGGGDEERMVTRKQKAEKSHETEQAPKKAKSDNGNTGQSENDNGRSTADIAAEFEKFCKATSEHITIEQMCEILELNGEESSGDDDAVVPRCQELMFYGPVGNCPVCGSVLVCIDCTYSCKGEYSEWSTCTFKTRDPPRKEEEIKFPDSVQKSAISDFLKTHQDPKKRSKEDKKDQGSSDKPKPFAGMMISLSGRLSRTHQYWKSQIEKHGGKVSNSVIGVTCLVTSPADRERGGSSKLAEAIERGIPVVREEWLIDSIEKKQAQPLDAYDIVSDLVVEGRGIPWDKQDPSEEALESLTAELKLYGKRGVHRDSKLQQQGGKILEWNGIVYNCAFSLCDKGRDVNEYCTNPDLLVLFLKFASLMSLYLISYECRFCIMQLIEVPESSLNMYYKKGRPGADPRAEERLEEWEDVDNAVKEFARLFEELTGNELEPWEKEKKFQKKPKKFYPIDMDDGVDIRHGGLGLRQMGVAVIHCKLDPYVANFMKVLCGQEVYRYSGTQFGVNVKAAAPLESIRDMTVASHLIGDMSGPTLDDPIFDCYKKLGCSISPLADNTEDYKMIVKYLEQTYEPYKVGEISYGVSVDRIFAVELSAGPSYDELKKLPNKLLLWCGTRSSNLLRHLHKGFLPSICSLPVPGYMFGKGIVCSDAAAEAVRYGFTAVDKPDGFLVLAVVSHGEQILEITLPPEDTKSLEEKKTGVKGLGRKTTEESEHFVWKDDIKVPCGRLVPSQHEDSPLEYNEYAVYDPNQACVRFLVGVKFEEQDVVYDVEE